MSSSLVNGEVDVEDLKRFDRGKKNMDTLSELDTRLAIWQCANFSSGHLRNYIKKYKTFDDCDLKHDS